MKRSVDAHDSQQTLLTSAVELIAEHGLDGFSMKQLAVKAGKSHGLASHHFESKRLLLDQVVTELLKPPTLSTEASGVGLERVLSYVRDTILQMLDDPVVARATYAVLGRVEEAAPYRGAAAELHGAVFSFLVEHLTAGVAAGEIRAPLDCSYQAFAIVAQLRGIAFMVLTSRRENNLAKLADEVSETLRRGLSRQDPSRR